MKRRFFAMLLSLAMLFTLAPTAFAVETIETSENQTETPELTDPATSGTSGGIDWKVENGVLTISATSSVENEYTTGQMKDYTSQMGEKVTDPTGWYALKNSITEIKIEEGVTHLGNYAFSYLTNVVKVNIPASITSLGDSIFRGDTALTTVEWASDFEAPEITDTDSNSDTYTGTYVPTSMFDGCTSLGSGEELSAWLPASFTGVGCAAFRGTQFTVDFNGWNNLKYIGAYGFAGMPNLDSFTLSNKITLGLRGKDGGASNAFNSSGLKSLTVADGITAIPFGMCDGCKRLSSVALANSITTIAMYAFRNTEALKEIDLKNVQTINAYAFQGSGLTALVLPKSVKEVGSRAFEACTSLAEVTINAAELTLDNNNTFAGCSSLSTVVTSADSKINGLNASAFGPDKTDYAQAPVERIEINGTVGTLNFSKLALLKNLTINGKNNLTSGALPSGFENLVINGDNWNISDYQFAGKTPIKHLVVSANAVSSAIISDNATKKEAEAAFRSNSNLETAQFTGTTVKLQDKMFLGCTGLNWLDLSAVDTLTVGSGCFGDDTSTSFGASTEKPNRFNVNCVIYAKNAAAAQTLKSKLGTKGIVLVVNGGTVDTAAENAGFSAVTKSGYTAKWYTAENFSGGAVTTPMAGNTYYAEWTMADSISLTSDSQKPVTYGTKVTLTASPVNSSWGYVWYKDVNGNGTLELNTDKQISNNKSTLELTNVSDSGTYWVQVIDGSSTKTSNAVNVTITKANGTASVSMEGWTYGETAKTPVPTSETNGTNGVTYQYKVKDADDNTYSTTVPTNVGSYTVKATFPATDNYKEVTATANFVIAQATHHSSGSSSSNPTYSVTTPSKSENGGVAVSSKNARKGDTVTVTVTPDAGYQLDKLTVTDKNGTVLKLTDKGDGKYSFTMPDGKVEVKAVFAKEVETSPFGDVSTDAYYYKAVKWAQEKGITEGISSDLFGPKQPCTRGQIVTFLWRAAGSPEPKGTAAGMTDVLPGSYYAKAVAWAVENGITTGTAEGTFSPDATCTRAQAVTFLARAQNATATGKTAFSDVPADSYFADAVAWAQANGVTTGTSENTFSPDNDCTRAQIVTFLYRANQGT